jgi:ubiquinol-cytochrome c reductase cytochrome b subunit
VVGRPIRPREAELMVRRTVRFLDERSGAAPFIKKTLRYAFPDHWSFLLGEVALYCFVVLVATGIFLTFYFEPSLAKTYYHGSYVPLQGLRMSDAYKSAVDISFEVKGGLLIRQVHHWAADVFIASIVLHLLRIFFTGAFRKPRELTWIIGLVMLFASLLEGFLGYAIVDDLLSGMGIAIAYGVATSVPLIGGNLALGIWGAPFPGDHAFESRMYIGHVLLMPVLIGTLIAIHLALVASRHHTQFRRKPDRQSNRKLLGMPTFPGQAPRSLGLFSAVAGVLFLLGGLVQINPIWQWGPYEIAQGTNGAQPDWYLGWLIGSLRLMPGFDVTIGDRTLVPNPFWGGALFPLVVLFVLMLVPWAERRITGDHGYHNVLDRPRDAPGRTAFGAAFFTWVFLIFFAGAADRIYLFLDWRYSTQIWVYRGLVLVAPFVVFFLVRSACRQLQDFERVEGTRHGAEQEAEQAARARPAGM